MASLSPTTSENKMPPVILFNSSTTVIGRRLDWYLTLRGVPFYLCRVDDIMPRPVLARLGVKYRRIPVLAVGRDVYCDSRCIIRVLEERYTGAAAGTAVPRLGADPGTNPYEAAVEQILETWALEILFLRTGSLVTFDFLAAQGREFIEDRRRLTGWTTTREGMAEKIPEAQTSTRTTLEILDGMLKDGRRFLGTVDDRNRPGLADVHLGWVFDWLYRGGRGKGSMPNAYPELLNRTQNPRVVDWVGRVNEVVEKKKRGNITSPGNSPSVFPLYPIDKIDQDQAVKMIEESEFWEEEEDLEMVQWDPTNLQDQKGVEVDLYTTDLPSGIQNKDTGGLVGMTADKVTISTKTKNGVDIRIHYPRSNVKVAKAKSML